MSVNTVKQDGSLQRIAGGTLYADAPIGTISPFGGSVIPSGYLLCNGAEVLKTAYAELYAVIGDAFGTASANTKFVLPDLRGEFLRGAGTNSHTSQGNGGVVGEHQNATTVPHIYSNSVSNNVNIAGKGATTNLDSFPSGTNYCQTINSDAHGGGSSYSSYNFGTVRPTNTSVNYIIKAKQVAVPADFMDAIDDAISAIKDGTNIDSFADVETALSGKADVSSLANYVTLDNSGAFPDANNVTKELVYINGFQSDLINYPSEVSNTVGILLTRWFYDSGNLTVPRMQLVFTLVGKSFCRFFDGTSWTSWSSTSVGLLSNLTTTDKSSCVGAINEVNGVINALNSRVMTSGNSYVQSVNFPCRSGYGCVSVNAFVQQYGSVIFDILVSDGNIVTKDRITGSAVSADVATFAYNNGVLTITFSNEATYTATFQTPNI